jgi:hypothetical protein
MMGPLPRRADGVLSSSDPLGFAISTSLRPEQISCLFGGADAAGFAVFRNFPNGQLLYFETPGILACALSEHSMNRRPAPPA